VDIEACLSDFVSDTSYQLLSVLVMGVVFGGIRLVGGTPNNDIEFDKSNPYPFQAEHHSLLLQVEQ